MTRNLIRTRLDRFMTKTTRRGGAQIDCLIWKGATNNGYPIFWDGTGLVRARRWIYEYYYGPLPEHTNVHMKCQTEKLCVEATHFRTQDRRPSENEVTPATTLYDEQGNIRRSVGSEPRTPWAILDAYLRELNKGISE